MKKITAALLLACTCACASEVQESSVKETDMNITIDTGYGGFRVCFSTPENSDHAEIECVREDRKPFLEKTTLSTDYDAYILYDLCAYTAVSNDWYGQMRVSVSFFDEKGKLIAKEYSDAFEVTDYFCEEETRSIEGREPYIFSFTSGQTSYKQTYQDDITSCTVIFDDEVSFDAVYYDKNEKEHEISRNLTESEIRKLTEFLQSGMLVRKPVRDPSVIMLDGSTPAYYHLTLADSDSNEERWYLFEAEKDRQDELADFLKELCR